MDKYEYDPKYKFNEQWFDHVIPLWDSFFKKYRSTENSLELNKVLEIGCYEGRATVWFCENIMNDENIDYEYHIVDSFGGSPEESGMSNTKERLKDDENIIENNFKHNISFFDNIDFTIHKGLSNKILPTLDEKYDFIYVDASHWADDTFVDGYYANKLLNTNGVMIFDDYGWKDSKRSGELYSPQLGVDVFVKMYSEYYTVSYLGYQVILVKTGK